MAYAGGELGGEAFILLVSIPVGPRVLDPDPDLDLDLVEAERVAFGMEMECLLQQR